MQQDFVWSDRRQVGRWRAFWCVIGYSLATPSRIGNTMTQKRDLRGALWFSFLCLCFAILGWPLIFIAFTLPFVGTARSISGSGGVIVLSVLFLLAMWVVLVLAQQLFVLMWGFMTHGLIRMTGRARRPLGHTLSATQYCSGTFILSWFPLCGMHLSLISIVWMAVAMVSALAALHKISRWRTALAVLVPPAIMFSILGWSAYAIALGFSNILNLSTPLNFPPIPQNSPAIVPPTVPDAYSSAPTDATEVETDPAATSQPMDAPTKNPNPVITDPTPTTTQDPAATNAPKNTSIDSAAILNFTHGI
jgi:hypothetical protein